MAGSIYFWRCIAFKKSVDHSMLVQIRNETLSGFIVEKFTNAPFEIDSPVFQLTLDKFVEG
jgi:hypothetical protein